MLTKSTIPFCVFDAPLEELRLSADFLLDLIDLLADEHLYLRAHQAIAQCLFNGAYARENITRKINLAPYSQEWIPATTSYAIIGSLILRPRYPLPDTAIRHLSFKQKFYPEHIREGVLELLWRYGVKCAKAGCCGALRMPQKQLCNSER